MTVGYKRGADQRVGITSYLDLEEVTSDLQSIMAHLCHICGKSFAEATSRARHVRQVHNGERHECDRCGRSYSQKSKLREHQKKCPTEWTCPTCRQVFEELLAFNRHKTADHPELVPKSLATRKRKRKYIAHL